MASGLSAGRGEHVGRGDGGRHALADEPLHDGHRAAFAERKNQARADGGEDALRLGARQPVLDQAGGQEDIDEAGDDRAEQQEGRAFQDDGEKGERDIGPRDARAGGCGGKIEGGEKHSLSLAQLGGDRAFDPHRGAERAAWTSRDYASSRRPFSSARRDSRRRECR